MITLRNARFSVRLTGVAWCVLVFWFSRPLEFTRGADQPQWGEQFSRNMVSAEVGLPDEFDPSTGQNIKWSIDLGSQAYASPVVAGGRVLIGTNNSVPQDPRHQGDRGVLLCLDEADGSFLWQLVVPRLLGDDGFLDQPNIGLCSPPSVEGDRVYVVTNRAEVVCLDLQGLANGNDGPYMDEGAHMVQPGETPMDVTDRDADILWLFDMPSQAGIHPHDSPHSSILIHGRYLYLNTGNGVDLTHVKIRKPDAPSLIVLDKHTGRLVAQDDERIGPRVFHCTWSSPALGHVGGRPLIFFCGGDGVVYAFEALPEDLDDSKVHTLQCVWRFDCDPAAPKEDVHRYVRNRQESPSNIMGMPVFYRDRVYVTGGGDFWWGKREAWVKCIDATLTGDITDSGELWSRPLSNHSCATPAIHNGLVFVGDLGRKVYCFDADTGELYWSHSMRGDVWSSILVADDKVYVGSHGRDFCVFAASQEKHLISSIQLESPMSTTPTAANGVLYFNTLTHLYAVESPEAAVACRLPADSALQEALNAVLAAQPESATDAVVAPAWQLVADAGYNDLPSIFAALDKASPVAANWLSMAVDRIVATHSDRGDPYPFDLLQATALDQAHGLVTRKTAIDLLERADPELVTRLQPQLLHDREAELRYGAVEQAIAEAERATQGEEQSAEQQLALWQRLLDAARDPSQVRTIARALQQLGQEVDTAAHFGYLLDWHVIGPFDNTGAQGFDTAYPPEAMARQMLDMRPEDVFAAAPVEGKSGPVAWRPVAAGAAGGGVYLNEQILNVIKRWGVGLHVFVSDSDRPAEIRLRVQNSFKVWLNGELLLAQPVGHTGNSFDQYVVPATLRRGNNWLLIKSCQVDLRGPGEFYDVWHFSVRVCDSTGGAILSLDRGPTPQGE